MISTDWITSCTSQVAKDSLDLLEEVLHDLDLLKSKIIINPYPPYVYSHSFDYELTDRYIQERMDVANMLIVRGVLKSAKATVRDGDDVITVSADREPVVLVIGALRKQIYGTSGGDNAYGGSRAGTKSRPVRLATAPQVFFRALIKGMGSTAGRIIGALLVLGLLGIMLRLMHVFR